MNERAMKRAVRRTLYEGGCEDEVARAIKQFEGWSMSDGAARHRLMQTLNESSPRQVGGDWLLIIARIAAYHDVPDYLTPLLQEERYAGRRKREAEENAA